MLGLFSNYFKMKNKKSAQVAKERLQILIAHERTDRNGPDYLPKLRRELMEVIRRYVRVDDEKVNVQYEKGDDFDILEVNISLPEERNRTISS